MKHATIVADVWELLTKEKMGYLEVFEGNCTGRTKIWVRRHHVGLGKATPLTNEELDVLDAIFRRRWPRNGPVFSYGIWKAQAAMALGVWRKQVPVCELCGLVYVKDADIATCAHPKMTQEPDR